AGPRVPTPGARPPALEAFEADLAERLERGLLGREVTEEAELLDAVDRDGMQGQVGGDDGGGLPRPFAAAGVDGGDRLRAQGGGHGLGLADADVGQRRVAQLTDGLAQELVAD